MRPRCARTIASRLTYVDTDSHTILIDNPYQAPGAEQTPPSCLRRLRSPNRWLLAIVALSLWFAHPFLLALVLEVELNRGTFPWFADSIAIPISAAFVTAVLLAPLFLGVVALATIKHGGTHLLLNWDHRHLAWSSFWTVLFGLAVLATLLNGMNAVASFSLTSACLLLAESLLWCYVYLSLRAAIVARPARGNFQQ